MKERKYFAMLGALITGGGAAIMVATLLHATPYAILGIDNILGSFFVMLGLI